MPAYPDKVSRVFTTTRLVYHIFLKMSSYILLIISMFFILLKIKKEGNSPSPKVLFVISEYIISFF